jgi:dTDP-glucose 4,6-dehydratase
MYLITGGLGFIGINFVKYCIKKNIKFIIIDSQTYASNLYKKFLTKYKSKIFNLNIGDKRIIQILRKNNVTKIINFAAETHVDNSINYPKPFIQTNVLNFFNFLEIVRNYYFSLNDGKKKKFIFLQVSTDEVYGSLKRGKFSETDKYYPNNPYSATKAFGDLLSRAWFKTYGLPIIVTNSCNNYGEHQNKEKLIPKVIFNAINHKSIPIYGTGKNIREWIYVLDHCQILNKILLLGTPGENYNIGSSFEIENIKLVLKICKILDKLCPSKKIKSYTNLIKFVKDRVAHDFRYSVNSNKINKNFNWKATTEFDQGLTKTIKFFINKSI